LQPDQHVIRHANGTTRPMPVCAYPHYTRNGEAVYGEKQGPTPTVNGYIEFAYAGAPTTSVCSPSSFSFFSSLWSVPSAPTSNDGQVLFYFPGLENAQGSVILQPVLQWNDPFPSAWGVAGWHCCPSGVAWEATPQKVSPGDTIYGAMVCSAGLPSPCTSWNVETIDLQNGNSSLLNNTSSLNQTFNVAFAGALEAYYVKQCTDFPPSDAVSFNNLILANNLGQQINPNWSVAPASSALTPQ
jgi:hypothetical protein